MLTNHKNFLTAPPPLQMRQHAPNNHILDLVVICMLSPLCMLLLHVALSLLGCVWPCIHLRLLYTTQTRATPGTIISRDCDPGLHHKPLISHEPRGSETHPEANLFVPPHVDIVRELSLRQK